MAGWTCVEEIEAYCLAVQLRDAIIGLTTSGPVARDFKFRDQIRDSSASAVRNISEGFDRFVHPQFAYLAGVARASLGETRANLEDGHARGYFSAADTKRLCELAIQARKTTAGLIRYLKSTPTPKQRPYRRRPANPTK